MNWLKKLFGKKQKPVEQTKVTNQSVKRNYRTTTSETTHPTYIGNQEDLLNPLNIMSPLNPIHNSYELNHDSNDSSPSYDNGNDSSPSYDNGSSYDSGSNWSPSDSSSYDSGSSYDSSSSSSDW